MWCECETNFYCQHLPWWRCLWVAGVQEGQYLSPVWDYQLTHCEVFHSCAWFKSTVEHDERSNFNLPFWQVLSASYRAGVMVSLIYTETHQPAKVPKVLVTCLFLAVYMSCPWIMVFPLDPQTALCFLWRNSVIPKHIIPLQGSIKHLYFFFLWLFFFFIFFFSN